MADDQEEILNKIRERVLEREKELRSQEDKEASIEATLQALEEITEVPRQEMERISAEIRASYEQPEINRNQPVPALTFLDKELPATVREALSKLPPVLRNEFYEEYHIQNRQVGISYLLWLIPPPFSCHYLYIRRRFTQILYSLTCGGLFLWWIVDLFRIPKLVEEDNRKTAKRILKKLLKHTLNKKPS